MKVGHDPGLLHKTDRIAKHSLIYLTGNKVVLDNGMIQHFPKLGDVDECPRLANLHSE